jgi:mono/diheme cytochrome c family protein
MIESQPKADPAIMVWGYSFAMHLMGGLLASDRGAGLLQMTLPQCSPILDYVPIPPELPPIEVTPPAPAQAPGVTPATIARGQALLFGNCVLCHANQHRSITPDLRRMQPGTHDAFRQIVLEGLLLPGGMPRPQLLRARDLRHPRPTRRALRHPPATGSPPGVTARRCSKAIAAPATSPAAWAPIF